MSYQEIAQSPYLSARFKTRFLSLTQEEILENERMWAEENTSRMTRMFITSCEQAREHDWKQYVEGWRKVARTLIVSSILTMTFGAGYVVSMLTR